MIKYTKVPYSLLANSQRVATTVVSEVEEVERDINNAEPLHPFSATSINSTLALLIRIPDHH